MPSKEQVKQRIAPDENLTTRRVVHDWIARRVAADEQMRWAGAVRKAQEQAREATS